MKGEHFGELARLPLEYQPVAEADSALLGRTTAVPPATDTAALVDCRDWFHVNWQKKILLAVLIFGATITVSPASGPLKPAKVATDEASQRPSTLVAKLDNQHNASTDEIGKAQPHVTVDHLELAQLQTQVSEADRASSSDVAALYRKLEVLTAEVDQLRQLMKLIQNGRKLAAIDNTNVAKLVQILQQQASADRAAVAQLRTQVSEAAQAPAPDAASDRQRTELAAEMEKLQQQASADRAAVAQLRTQVSEAAQAPAPDVAGLDRQMGELAAEIKKLRRAATDNHAGLDRLEKQFGEAFRAPPRPTDTSVFIPQPQQPPQFTATIAASPDVALPSDTAPRVILRFARNRDSVRTRATTLERSLRAQGFDIVKSGGSPPSSRADKVMYFYKEDRPSAQRIAAGLAEAELIQRPFADDGSLPPPGTIEVAIGR